MKCRHNSDSADWPLLGTVVLIDMAEKSVRFHSFQGVALTPLHIT